MVYMATSPPDKWSITPRNLASVSITSGRLPCEELHRKHAEKLREVRHELRMMATKDGEGGGDNLGGLRLVDAIQCLRIDYHFKEEIEAVLNSHYRRLMMDRHHHHHHHHQDLFEASLRFRLLRQGGYYVNADMFNNFKDKDGNFNEELSGDIRGLMSLYEAAQLRIEGETILDEASQFSSELLITNIPLLDDDHHHHHQATVVRNTLEHPHHKSLWSRLQSKMTFLRGLTNINNNNFNNHNNGSEISSSLGDLAEMDFILLRSIHQRELHQIAKWWEGLGLAKDLEFIRDQPLKWHAWSMHVIPDPSLSEQRIQLTKPISLVYVIDDIFDVYGKLEDLTLFTEAVHRWEVDAVEQLPDYMKKCYKALHDITDEISDKVYKEHGQNPKYYLREVWENLCKAFLTEAKWFASGKLPKSEEYLKNGMISSGVYVILLHLFFLLGGGGGGDADEFISSSNQENNQHLAVKDYISAISSSVATILRLWDDLGSAKDENQDGRDGSYIECYMKEHPEITCIKEARQHVVDKISDAWMCLNEQCLSPSPLSSSFKDACLNTARMIPLVYSYDENGRLPILEEYIKSMFY